MSAMIRHFTPDDYPAVVEINNLLWEDEPLTVEELTEEDKYRDPKCKFQRWVAEHDGQVVGMGQYNQLAGRYHPDKYWMELDVHPNHQRRGIGSALLAQVMTELQTLEPMLVRVALREDMKPGLNFLSQRGFSEEWRSWEMSLDLSTYELMPELTAKFEATLQSEGIVIKSYKALAEDAERGRKLYALHEETRAEAPFPDPATAVGYDAYMATIDSRLDHDGYFVALHGDDYVGMSAFERPKKDDKEVETGWTGVQRSYRGKGIATVLKQYALRYAKEQGYTTLYTTINSLNAPSIAMNKRIGYRRELAWVYYTKVFEDKKGFKGIGD